MSRTIEVKSKIATLLSDAAYIEDQGLKYGFLLSVFRYIIQTAAYTAFELIPEIADIPDGYETQAKRLLQPSDGDFVSSLDLCIPALKRAWPNIAHGWFDHRGTQHPETGNLLCLDIISKRNDRIAHGVFDQHTLLEELESLGPRLSSLVEILTDLLPSFEEKKTVATINTPLKQVVIQTVVRHGDELVLLRKLEYRGSIWRIKGQALNYNKSTAVFVEVSENNHLVRSLVVDPSRLTSKEVSINDESWRVSLMLPLRQTEVFEGRRNEIDALLEWWKDEDSRACLVFGEGGIGKTTLVLEFLNEILENPPAELGWRPALIFFYSAKLTRWGSAGLEHIGSGMSENVNEAIRTLVSILENRLEREWYSEDTKALISRASTLFKSAGLSRDSILIVLDNTETLARNSLEEHNLGKSLREVSTKLGKLIVTSRRREGLEATPVPVPSMSDEVGAELLSKLATTYSALALEQSGEARRRRVSKQLGGKPILLDVLTRHLANTQCSIEDGITAILRQERGDLGAFLFEDAWKRMESAYRDVFLAIGQLGGSVSEHLVNWSCAEFSCVGQSWLTAFEETRFGSLVDYGSSYDLTLDPGAREFLASKYEKLTEIERQRIQSAVGRVVKKNKQAISASEERITDRVQIAFRTTAAKAAKLAGARRDVEEAIRWYEEATIVDSSNAALFDRFAWFLMVNDRLDKAAVISRKACELNENDSDAQFTYGMIAARRAEIATADTALEKSVLLGKPRHLATLQKARARLEKAIQLDITDAQRRRDLTAEAMSLLNSSTPSSRGNHEKHELERSKLLNRCHGLIQSVRSPRTV